MRVRGLALALALGAEGCIFHQHLDGHAFGHVSLEAPPPAAPAPRAPHSSPHPVPVQPADPAPDVTSVSVAAPVDPGEQGVILGVSAMGGYASGLLDGSRRNAGHIQLEANLFTFSQEHAHRGWITPKALHGSTRAALGLGLRIFDGQGGESPVRMAPIYLEVQHTRMDEIWGATFGLGAAFAPHSPRAVGPQLTACFGIPIMVSLCGRGAYLLGQGHEITIMMGYNGFVEWVTGR